MTDEYDSTARAILDSGSEEGDSPISRQGQDSVAQRCPAAAYRYLYGEALTTAAANRQFDVMKFLFESNSSFGIEDLTKTLESVCGWGSEEALEIVLKHDVNRLLGIPQYSSGLKEAALKSNGRIVQYWLEEHPENRNLVVDPTTVIDAAGNGLLDILCRLIKKIRLMDSSEAILNQSLQVASTMGHKEVVKYLIKEGAHVNAVVEEALRTIGEDRYNGIRSTRKVSALQAALIGFERFAPEIQFRYAPSLKSAWQGANASSQQQCIEILLANGADPNRVDGYERYPLNIAARYGTVETVEKLISSGAHAEKSTKDHGTALQAAAGRELGTLPIIRALLNACRPKSSVDFSKAAALDKVLSFFATFDGLEYSTAVKDVLSTGPGAAVKFLLPSLPEQKTDNYRYGLLAQMACMAGDQGCVELLLQHGMDVNGTFSYQDWLRLTSQHGVESNGALSNQDCDESYRVFGSSDHYGTLLQAASRVGNVKIVECLIKAGADVNIVQGAHGTALRAAVAGGHKEVVLSLIARGADVNLRNEDGDDSVLHLVLKSRNSEIFKALLDAGADFKNSHRRHILITVCKIGDATLVEHLLCSGADINVYDKASPLNKACAGGHLSVVRLLLDHGADIENANESSVTPLIAAVRGNNLSVVRLLLETGANVNHATRVTPSWNEIISENVTPLSEAAGNGRLEIVEELLSVGAIIGRSSIESNALMEACASRHRIIVELLLETLPGTRYEAEVYSEAFSAAMNCGSDEIACLLLEHGMPPSFEMLRQACAAGALETVRMLVDTGIDIVEDDGNDAPLLHVAAMHSNPEVVQFLIDRGANVMLCSAKYGSPLIAALEGTMAPFLRSWPHSKSCRSLAKQLPLPDLLYGSKGEGRTTLGYKEVSQCEQIVRSLFDASAKMDTTIRSFGNALHLASYMGSEVIVRQLLANMENVNIFGGHFDSPLIAGLRRSHIRIVDLLLNRDVDVNRHSPGYGSALHEACAHGSQKLVQTLLDHGADASAYDDNHGSVLAVAASQGSRSRRYGDTKKKRRIVELLLRHEPKIQIRESDLLAAASWMAAPYHCEHYTSTFLEVLVEYGKTVKLTPQFKKFLDEKLQELDEEQKYKRPEDQMSETIRKLFYRLEATHVVYAAL